MPSLYTQPDTAPQMAALVTTCKSKVGDLDSSLSRQKSESFGAEGCQVWVAVENARSACTSKLCHALAGLGLRKL